MSVACGHARELEMVATDNVPRIGRFVAYDQDRESLAVAASYKDVGIPVEPVVGNITRLLGSKDLGEFDLIFAAGLYDYLSSRLAEKLTTALFGRLKPRGKVVIGNFLPNLRDAGYMEIFMEWVLTYRDPGEIIAFADGIEKSGMAEIHFFKDPGHKIGIVEITRA